MLALGLLLQGYPPLPVPHSLTFCHLALGKHFLPGLFKMASHPKLHFPLWLHFSRWHTHHHLTSSLYLCYLPDSRLEGQLCEVEDFCQVFFFFSLLYS